MASTSVEVRTQLLFCVSGALLQRLLPPGWQANPATSGPAQGANLVIVLTDRLITQDADGRAIPGGVGQALILAVPGRNPTTGDAGPVIIGGFSSPAEGAPGAYGVFVPAELTLERAVTAAADGMRRGWERWTVNTSEGDRFDLRLRYTLTPPIQGAARQHVYSGRNPEFYRIYQVDQGTVVLRGAGTDRIEDLAFSVGGPRLSGLFDGAEHLVGVLSLPWYVRRVLVP